MKSTIFLTAILVSLSSFGGLTSPFVGTIEGLDTPNTHYVGDSFVIRGQTPGSLNEYGQLKDAGIKSVIIFKNQTKNEVDQEKETLKELKIKYTHIEFPWKDITEFKPVCEKALAALKILKANNDKEIPTYFHCTVGEDRTGVLAGLFLQVLGQETDVAKIYQEEMCEKGYAEGDHNKIASVANTVRSNLNPVFLKMSYLLKKANYDLSAVNCGADFENDQNYKKSTYSKPASFRCQ